MQVLDKKRVSTGQNGLRLRNYTDESESKNKGEIIRIGEDFFIIDEPVYSFEAKGNSRRLKWEAVWSGCDGVDGFVVEGDSREYVITEMTELIKRRKALKGFKGIFRRRYIQQAVNDFVDGKERRKKLSPDKAVRDVS